MTLLTRLACLLALLASCTSSSSSPVDAAMFPDTGAAPPDTATCEVPRFPRCVELSGCVDVVPIAEPGCEPPRQDGMAVHVCYRQSSALDVWCVQ